MHIQVQSTPDYPVGLDNPGKYKIPVKTKVTEITVKTGKRV